MQQVDPRAEAQPQWHMGLVAPQPAGSSQTRDGTRVPRLGRRILYPWATREAQQGFFSFFFFTEWTTHARKGLPALLTLKPFLSSWNVSVSPVLRYISQTWTLRWAGSWQEGWDTVSEGYLVQTHNPAFRNHRWLLKA